MFKNVLVVAGLDPSGGAGVVADVETLNQFGITPLVIVTTLTVQNTQSVMQLQAVDNKLIGNQFRHLIKDIDIDVVKIGLLSSVKQIQTIADLFIKNNNLVVVLDPIINASTKDNLLSTQMLNALKRNLLPLVSVLTPNLSELQRLAPSVSEQRSVQSLPCEWVLVTTTDSSEFEVVHRLYHRAVLVKHFKYQKLQKQYHGSGCTLSSAISALIASGMVVDDACKRALDYTYQTLLSAKSVGKMQLHPNRQKPL